MEEETLDGEIMENESLQKCQARLHVSFFLNVKCSFSFPQSIFYVQSFLFLKKIRPTLIKAISQIEFKIKQNKNKKEILLQESNADGVNFCIGCVILAFHILAHSNLHWVCDSLHMVCKVLKTSKKLILSLQDLKSQTLIKFLQSQENN